MTCDEIDELLSDLLDDELAEGPRNAVERHLASCEPCAASYRALKRTVRFVRGNAPTGFTPDTPGSAYMGFTRAMVDESYGRTPEEAIVSSFADMLNAVNESDTDRKGG
jgi:hypothetical protein